MSAERREPQQASAAHRKKAWSPNHKTFSTKMSALIARAKTIRKEPIRTLAHFMDEDWLHESWKRLCKGASAGIDAINAQDYAATLDDNINNLQQKLLSGNYKAPPVRRVYIPKADGKQRPLGLPTVEDKVAQNAVGLMLTAIYEQDFLPSSYGFRPSRNAHQAVEGVKAAIAQGKVSWVLDADIQSFFDNLDHELLMKAVKKHTDNKWIILYIERWLKTPMQLPDGSLQDKTKGVMQGGVISPVLSNLFLHYVFDAWMKRKYPTTPWCRYADDGLAHCRTKLEAERLLLELQQRFKECGLEMHPDKTKIVYCKDGKRKGHYQNTKFNFLGYEFRRRIIKGSNNNMFLSFTPAICKEAKKNICRTIRETGVRNRSDLSLEQIASWLNPMISGWINYYGKFNKSALKPVMRQINFTLVKWCTRKYNAFRYSKAKACQFMINMFEKRPHLFAHWKRGIQGSFV